MHTPKVTKRFLPTLTEVVKPVQAPLEGSGADVSTVEALDLMPNEALVDAVLHKVLPELELRIEQALQQSLRSHWDQLIFSVASDVKRSLREVVSDAVHTAQPVKPE